MENKRKLKICSVTGHRHIPEGKMDCVYKRLSEEILAATSTVTITSSLVLRMVWTYFLLKLLETSNRGTQIFFLKQPYHIPTG